MPQSVPPLSASVTLILAVMCVAGPCPGTSSWSLVSRMFQATTSESPLSSSDWGLERLYLSGFYQTLLVGFNSRMSGRSHLQLSEEGYFFLFPRIPSIEWRVR